MRPAPPMVHRITPALDSGLSVNKKGLGDGKFSSQVVILAANFLQPIIYKNVHSHSGLRPFFPTGECGYSFPSPDLLPTQQRGNREH